MTSPTDEAARRLARDLEDSIYASEAIVGKADLRAVLSAYRERGEALEKISDMPLGKHDPCGDGNTVILDSRVSIDMQERARAALRKGEAK